MLYVNDHYFSRAYFDRCFKAFARNPVIGLCQGKRLAVRMSSTAYWLALCLFIKQRGGSVLALPPEISTQAARRKAAKSGCHLLLSGDDAIDSVEVLRAHQGEHNPALLQMSSGTTGAPKQIARSWVSIDREIDAYVQHFPEANFMTPVIACPVTHAYGLISGVLVALQRGAQPVIVDNPNPKYILRKMLEVPRPILYASPTLLATTLMLAPEQCKLNAVMTSGSALQKTWFENLQRRVGRVYQQYGCSEAGCIALGQGIERANQLGKPLPHLQVSAGEGAANPGEIIVTLTDDAKVETRDLGYFDDRGQLHFVSRLDDMINVSGFNVYPAEVEEVVLEFPQISDAVVYKRSLEFGFDQVCLDYVADVAIAADVIREWCLKNLARHQVPTNIKRVSAIAKLANGKISRKSLAQPASACLAE